MNSAHNFIGRHLMASYAGCDAGALANHAGLMAAMKQAIEASGATLVKTAEHVFENGAITAIFLLSESHASIHTYPQVNACFVDMFTCGNRCTAEGFDKVMLEYLKPGKVHRRVLTRNENSCDDSFTEFQD